jgi:hypothetical protein
MRILFFVLISLYCHSQKLQPFSYRKLRSDTYVNKAVAPANTKCILMFGQSNATGAELNANVPSGLSGPISNAKIFNLSTRLWETLEDGVNNRGYVSTPTNNLTFGCELKLMDLLGANYSTTQYLFKYSEPNTYLYNTGNSWNVFTVPTSAGIEQYLYISSWISYNNMFERLPVSVSPSWLVWIHGENDCANGTHAAAYQANITDFINNYRAITGLGTNLKVVLVSLSINQTALNSTNRTTINTAMSTVAGTLTNVFYLSQNGTCQVDNVHYDAAGYSTIATGIYNIIVAN